MPESAIGILFSSSLSLFSCCHEVSCFVTSYKARNNWELKLQKPGWRVNLYFLVTYQQYAVQRASRPRDRDVLPALLRDMETPSLAFLYLSCVCLLNSNICFTLRLGYNSILYSLAITLYHFVVFAFPWTKALKTLWDS